VIILGRLLSWQQLRLVETSLKTTLVMRWDEMVDDETEMRMVDDLYFTLFVVLSSFWWYYSTNWWWCDHHVYILSTYHHLINSQSTLSLSHFTTMISLWHGGRFDPNGDDVGTGLNEINMMCAKVLNIRSHEMRW